MAVEKMHLSMPLPAGLEDFPFTSFQKAFTVKLRAEQGAPILKAKVKKAKLKVEKAKVKPAVKAKAKALKVDEAKPEVKEAKTKVELKTMTAEEEEVLLKFVALLEKEEDFLDAKAEAEAEAAKCGSKRKPELERDEEGAAFLAWIEATKPPTDQEEYSDGYVSDSQDDDIYERHVRANNARWPFLIGRREIP